jgi:hypothetical protein
MPNYVVSVGPGEVPIYGGQDAPVVGLPAWIGSAALWEVIEIPGSLGADGASMIVWGSHAVDRENNVIYIGANGGHGDSYDNRWSKFNIGADSPAWERLIDPTPFASVIIDSAYYLDGRPSSRHNYDYCHYLNGKVYLTTSYGLWGNGNQGSTFDEYNVATNTLAPAGTHPSTAGHGYGSAVNYVSGKIFYNTLQHYDPIAKTYSATGSSNGTSIRYPVVYDEADNQYFCLQWGGGESSPSSSTLQASKVSATTLAQTNVTFNASAAYTQFLSEKLDPVSSTECVGYVGMTYDSANDCFYWCSGRPGRTGNIYKITKSANNTDPWDMTLPAKTGVSLPATPGAGLNGRIKFWPVLGGFTIDPAGGGKIYFVRTVA